MDYYNYPANKILDELKTSSKGLSQQEAEKRLEKYCFKEEITSQRIKC